MKIPLHSGALLAFGFALSVTSVSAAEVGKIKVSTGAVYIERAAQRLPAAVGAEVFASDTIITGENGSAGLTFIDNSRLSIGPNSVLAIDRLNFDQTTHDGAFDTSLKRGTLSVISGKIAKRSPDAMTVRTPSMILGVRGTEFVVRAGE